MDREIFSAYQVVMKNEIMYKYSDTVRAEHTRILALPEEERILAYEQIFNSAFERLQVLCEIGQLAPVQNGKVRELYLTRADDSEGMTFMVDACRVQDMGLQHTGGYISVVPLLYGQTCIKAPTYSLQRANGLDGIDLERHFDAALLDLLDYQETIQLAEEFIA
jgi:hypothetical protein